MVKNTHLASTRAFTLVEIIVSMVLMGILFTGILVTSTITLQRISSNLRLESQERQMDRAQMEIGYFISRAGQWSIYANSSAASAANPQESTNGIGDYLECWLQDDPLEPTTIDKVAFSMASVSGGGAPYKLTITTTSGDGASAVSKTYTYTHSLIKPAGRTGFFKRNDDGFLEYSWDLDSGYGIESFSNMAMPRTSL
jgi:prepilin-type N-terminal cleavage/methylation domain-containing protein